MCATIYATVCKIVAYVRGFGRFFRIEPALYAEKSLISTWAEKTNLDWPKSKKLTMEIEKIYMKMEEEDMRSYLEQVVSNFAGRISRNLRLKF